MQLPNVNGHAATIVAASCQVLAAPTPTTSTTTFAEYFPLQFLWLLLQQLQMLLRLLLLLLLPYALHIVIAQLTLLVAFFASKFLPVQVVRNPFKPMTNNLPYYLYTL